MVFSLTSVVIAVPSDDNVAESAVTESTDELDIALLDSSTTPEEVTEEETPSENRFYATPLSLLPPVIAIVLALITKEVYSSLFVGILAGALMTSGFKITGTLDVIINDGMIGALQSCAGIFIFLVLLGMLVALINKTGASAAFGRWAETHIKTRAGAMLATFILGILIFIDDYFNCLTVGSVMKPVTDSHKISRAKLSYLIDATAAPVCMIAPISSWAAAVSEFSSGTGYSGLQLFIRAIPYNFYSLLTFVFILGIILMKFDYGPMKKHELNAINNGDLFTTGEFVSANASENTAKKKGKLIDLIIPIAVLIIICVYALVYVGGIGYGVGFIDAFAGTDATVGLPWGGIVAVIFAVIYLILRRTISFKDAMECLPNGFKAMVPAITILTFATTLKNITSLLGADEFVKELMDNAASGLSYFLPAIIFLVACFLAFSTGTSWGTFGILIPIVVNIFPASSELLYIGISACLAGAVCGDHISPISDTTIMSSAGAECDHINHVSTQIPYALTVAAISFVSYIIAAFVKSWYITLPISILLTIGTLFVIKNITKEKN
ncbi:MAG: Na+/H+ antiporter NhaC family protein [Clostridiales bacterium]|nr:Na+/H+ antiporter NhaC family protein [Clostridiales bacterium]